MPIRENIEFYVPCKVVIEDGKFKKVLLDCNDWGDFAEQSIPDLTDGEFSIVETKCGVQLHEKLDWDWM
jgi:hypothetical protein